MLSLHEIILRLTVAAALGAVIGLERVVRRRPAGVRTSLFVCLATALFTILSNELAHRFGDSSGTRIASNIVQGIGFLGAGAILRGSGPHQENQSPERCWKRFVCRSNRFQHRSGHWFSWCGRDF